MERTKGATRSKIRWINNGGPFYMKDTRRIPSGETFLADESEIPQAFRRNIKPCDPVAAQAAVIVPVTPGFHIVNRSGTSFFDLFDGSERRMNEKDLNEKEAKELLDKLI